jgi:hypothetical protein
MNEDNFHIETLVLSQNYSKYGGLYEKRNIL